MFPTPAPPSPADFDPFSAPPCTVGMGIGGAPRPAPPRPVKKIASPSIPAKNHENTMKNHGDQLKTKKTP